MLLFKSRHRAGAILAITAMGGCAAAPHIQLSAADSMDLLSSSLATAIDEYGRDLDQLDAERRKRVVDAFVVRVRSDPQNETAIAAHSAAFHAALDRIEADRRTALERRQAAIENLETLQEIADGLRRVAVESMNLDDEARRYLTEVLLQVRTTKPSTSGEQHVSGK